MVLAGAAVSYERETPVFEHTILGSPGISRSKDDGYVLQPQHVNLRIVLQSSEPEAGSYMRGIDFPSLNLRRKNILGPVRREKKKNLREAQLGIWQKPADHLK